jgi:hypothetical protein
MSHGDVKNLKLIIFCVLVRIDPYLFDETI